jgi:hypothetical protein
LPSFSFSDSSSYQTGAIPYPLFAVVRHGPLHLQQGDGLVLLHGHEAVLRLGLYAAADRALAGESVLYLDGANAFDPFVVSRLARTSHVLPRTILTSIHLSRAFTCHQMTRLVTDGLPEALRAHRARTVIVSGPFETFYDETVPAVERARLAQTLVASLRALARRGCRILCVCPPPPVQQGGVDSLLLPHLCAHADRVIAVTDTGDSLALRDEHLRSAKSWHIPRTTWGNI